MYKWVADFETTGSEKEKFDGTAHVWGVGICEVGNPQNTTVLKTIDEFMAWCENLKNNDLVYFHNLRFDGNFIIQWLMKNDFKFFIDGKERCNKSFTCVISDVGLWYEIEVYFVVKPRSVKKVTFRDSLKLIPLSVREIAKSFKLPIQKGKIDYKAHDLLPEGSELTEEEKDYIIKDVQIVEHAVNYFHQNGLEKVTIGSCAMESFKNIFSKKMFKMYFPTPFYDADVRKTYKGGWSYLNPEFEGRLLKNLIVLDVNSLYPSVMSGCDGQLLPYGTPVFYKGQYEEDPMYPLYVQRITCSFELKEGKIPTIQIKNNYYYKGNQYLTSSDGDEVDLYLTSVDLELFLQQYEVKNLQYIAGWKFKATPAGNLFGEYVKKWYDIKDKAKAEGNWGMYLIAKLMLNNLYGKFGSKVKNRKKIPYVGKDGKMHFKLGEYEVKDGIYIAMASFISAHARYKTITAAQKIEDDYRAGKSNIRFVYADTDSLHCISPDFSLPEGLDIDSNKLGAWDHEANATQAKFIRQKCYIEKHIISKEKYDEAMLDEDTIKSQYEHDNGNYYYTKITVAGMPESCYDNVTFENFEIGTSYEGKLSHKTVDGGVVLEDGVFTIKE